MAELGDIQIAPDGQPHKLSPQGWKPISVEEAQAESRPAAERFVGGVLGAETSGAAGAAGNLLGLGSMVGGPAALGVKGAVRGAQRGLQRAGLSRMAPRVQQQIQAQARPGVRDTSAGAAAVGEPPAQQGFVGKLADEFLEPQPLRTDQSRILNQAGRANPEITRAEELGFRFLPGQREGRNLLVASAKSDPILSPAFDPVFTGNRQQGARFARRAIGLEDGTEFGRAELGQAADEIGARLTAIGDDIGEVALTGELRTEVNALKKLDPDLEAALGSLAEKGEQITVQGDQIMAMRSTMGKLSRQSWKQGNQLRAERVDKVIKELDKLIADSIGPGKVKEFKVAREQWRSLIQLEKPGVVADAGDISFERLANNFRKEFKGDFARSTFAKQGSNLEEPTANLLDFTKIASAFKDNVGDSGTATRLGIQNLLKPGGIKELGKRKALQKVLSQMVDNLEPIPVEGPLP